MDASPYKEMYHLLAVTAANVEQLLHESLSTANAVPQDMKNQHQIQANLLSAQIQAAMTMLTQSLIDAESLLLEED